MHGMPFFIYVRSWKTKAVDLRLNRKVHWKGSSMLAMIISRVEKEEERGRGGGGRKKSIPAALTHKHSKLAVRGGFRVSESAQIPPPLQSWCARSLASLSHSLSLLPFQRSGGLSSPHISYFYTMLMFMIFGRYTLDNLGVLTTYIDCTLIYYTIICIYM